MTNGITIDMLRAKRACADQVVEFERRFPYGVTFKSEADAVRKCEAVGTVFEWDWAAENFLTAALWEKYEKGRAPLQAEYVKARVALREKYIKATKVPMWDEYWKGRAPLWEKYWKGRAPLFARLLWKQYKELEA